MLRAGVEGLAEGAERRGAAPTPTALAVTMLTSDDGAPPHILPKRVGAAVESGCGGIVCAAADVREARAVRARGSRSSCPASGPRAPRITIRPAPRHLGDALDAGADLLVIGRAVTEASTRPQPRLPSSHPSPETPEFSANCGSWTRSRQENERRLSRGPTRESPALGCRPCRILPPVSRPASGRSEKAAEVRTLRGRAQGEAQDGLGHPS